MASNCEIPGMGFFGIEVFLLIVGAISLVPCRAIDAGGGSGLEIGLNENNVTSTFLNFGQKTNGSQRYWYEHLDDVDRVLKSKADILSRLLKMHIDRLRNKTDQVRRDIRC